MRTRESAHSSAAASNDLNVRVGIPAGAVNDSSVTAVREPNSRASIANVDAQPAARDGMSEDHDERPPQRRVEFST
jgi:hypothetical protein